MALLYLQSAPMMNGENIRIDEPMHSPSGNQRITGSPSSRVHELELILPTPPTPLGAYVESSDAGNLLILSGMLPVTNGKLAISGRLDDNLSIEQGRWLTLFRLTPSLSRRYISAT